MSSKVTKRQLKELMTMLPDVEEPAAKRPAVKPALKRKPRKQPGKQSMLDELRVKRTQADKTKRNLAVIRSLSTGKDPKAKQLLRRLNKRK